MSLTNYSKAESWMKFPARPTQPVDVFYIYPTGYYDAENGQAVCEITNPFMRKRALDHVTNKGSAFATVGNFYVPWYRQACLDTVLADNEADMRPFFEKTVPDVFNAFVYYMEHVNNGRPYILAGHSQGSLILSLLLANLFKAHPKYQRNMIAAYVIGWSITKDYLLENPHLKFAEGADDTGVIISYNTEAPGMTCRNVTLLPKAVIINPVSWTRGDEYVPKTRSAGSHTVHYNPDGSINAILDRRHFASAKCNLQRGVIECDSVDPVPYRVVGAEELFPIGILHNADLCLYYYDLRKNAELRAKKWFETH